LSLISSAMPLAAQENKEPPKREHEGKAAEREHKNTERAPRERQAAPQSNAPAQHQAPEQRQDRPARAPQMPQAQQPAAQPVNRPPANPNGQPGRTFGNQPGQPAGQPGRTFGNPPGRPSETGRVAPRIENRPAAPSPRMYTTRTGDVIRRDPAGQVRQVRLNNGTVIYHPPNAPRRVEVVRPGGRVIVASSPGHGYVQRPVVIQNTTIIKRTYIFNGVPQARIYRPRLFNGVSLVVYTPVRYYRPAFYVYAFNPWPRPVIFTWGWMGSPWYGYYGGYFAPYPAYAGPSLWLTDYFIAATLEDAYQQRMAANAAAANAAALNAYGAPPPPAPITPEVKQAIADEVRRQIDLERAQGQSANMPRQDPNIFTDNTSHVFVVNTPLVVAAAGGGECTVGEGDVLQMTAPPPPNSPSADVIVLSSRGQDCRKGDRVQVGLQDLQEMHNQMMATLDRGMGDLQVRQGQGGLPALPQGSAGTIDSPWAHEAQPDANAATELTTVSQEADRAEQVAIQGGEGGPAPTLTLGLSIDQVKAIQGEPEKVVDLGSKKIYVYKDLKITFIDGKVTDIQ
jgi:hypothetical protein